MFKVQLFESHEKNMFLVDKKDWYCEKCKKNISLSRQQNFPDTSGNRLS